MKQSRIIKEAYAGYHATSGDLAQPLILEEDGKPIAALIPIDLFDAYNDYLEQATYLTANQALRAANAAVFGDLVGGVLHCDEPVWIPKPTAQWRVPYRLIDGTLVRLVSVDAHTGFVHLTEDEQADMFEVVKKSLAVTPS